MSDRYIKEITNLSSMKALTAVIHKEEGVYVAKCPEVGTASQGNTIEEAVANLKEATELYLEEFPLENSEVPLVTMFEVNVDAAVKESSRA